MLTAPCSHQYDLCSFGWVENTFSSSKGRRFFVLLQWPQHLHALFLPDMHSCAILQSGSQYPQPVVCHRRYIICANSLAWPHRLRCLAVWVVLTPLQAHFLVHDSLMLFVLKITGLTFSAERWMLRASPGDGKQFCSQNSLWKVR